MQRILWVDLIKGFCMIAILWFHTEMYFIGYDKIPYAIYVGDVLATFFFLTGYIIHCKPIDLKRRGYYLFRKILIPYFFFTSIIAIPKAIAHHNSIDLSNIIIEIISGQASWYIAALLLSEFWFFITIYFTKGKISVLIITSAIALVLSDLIGNNYQPSNYFFSNNYWHFNESLLGYFFIIFGYIYKHFEKYFLAHQITQILILGILCICCKYYILSSQPQLCFGPIIVSNYFLFITDMIIFILFIVNIFKLLPHNSLIQWTGSHSLVYYFICGGVPLLVSIVCNKLGFNFNGYFTFIPVFIIVYMISTVITWFVYKYIPMICHY